MGCRLLAVLTAVVTTTLAPTSWVRAGVSTKGPVVVSAPPSPAPARQRKLALLIGVEQFDDERWPALRFTDDDATQLAQQLAAGGGFETWLLTGTEGTTRAAFSGALEQLEREPLAPTDTVLVYVSTHGTLAKSIDGQLRQVLVLRDTAHDRPLDTGLDVGELLARFDALPSQRKVLILSTCYSGTGKSSLSDRMQRYLAGAKGAVAPPLYDVSSAAVVLSASAWGEPAREDERLGHDVYTHFLLEAMRGYDPNGDGATSVTEAHDFARRQTYRFTGGAQRPTALMSIEGEDPVLLSGERSSPGQPVLLSYRESLDGLRVAVDGVEKGELPGGVAVEPGWREVVLTQQGASGDERELLRRRVLLRSGEIVDLGQLYDREPPLQLELQLGAGLRPGSEHGSPVLLLWQLGGLVRRQDVVLSGLDLSAALALGYGGDTLRINQERYPVHVGQALARVGIGAHIERGALTLRGDLWGGAGGDLRVVDSPAYEGPRSGLFGLVGASAAVRWRVARHWSLGAGGGLDLLLGTPFGLGGSLWMMGALSL